jgi:two-component system NtrC family sensor kinase
LGDWWLHVVLLSGTLISVLCWSTLAKQDDAILHQRLANRVKECIAHIEAQAEQAGDNLRAVQALFATSQHVERDEFDTFVASTLAYNSGTVSISWMPLVLDAERDSHEATQQQQVSKYRISEFHKAGGFLPASSRERYFPVTYSTSRDDRRIRLGWDIAEQPAVRKVIDDVALSGKSRVLPAA